MFRDGASSNGNSRGQPKLHRAQVSRHRRLREREDSKADDKSFGACALTILSRFEGKNITLKGYMKTENVKNGWAGLWIRINKGKVMLEFNNMQEDPILGTNDWKEYSITVPFHNEENKILIGGLLVGEGKAWFDNFRVFIDAADRADS